MSFDVVSFISFDPAFLFQFPSSESKVMLTSVIEKLAPKVSNTPLIIRGFPLVSIHVWQCVIQVQLCVAIIHA